jgi:hypothetical protein
METDAKMDEITRLMNRLMQAGANSRSGRLPIWRTKARILAMIAKMTPEECQKLSRSI